EKPVPHWASGRRGEYPPIRNHAGSSQTLPFFQTIIGRPRRRSSMRFFRVARRWAHRATRAHSDISSSGIGFRRLCNFFMSELCDSDDQPEVKNLLTKLKSALPELEALLKECTSHWGYEDPIYRFYHQSFKVYQLQS